MRLRDCICSVGYHHSIRLSPLFADIINVPYYSCVILSFLYLTYLIENQPNHFSIFLQNSKTLKNVNIIINLMHTLLVANAVYTSLSQIQIQNTNTHIHFVLVYRNGIYVRVLHTSRQINLRKFA